MKKKLPVITLIITGLIIFLGYYTYNRFIYPNYINNGKQSIEINLKKDKIIHLKKLKSQKNVYSLILDIKGKSDQNIHLILRNSDSLPIQNISLKKGEIDYLYSGDWYSDDCFLEIAPGNSGHLKVEYQFLALD